MLVKLHVILDILINMGSELHVVQIVTYARINTNALHVLLDSL